MEQVMMLPDDKGIFGSKKERESIFLFAEESPADDEDEEYFKRARRMNPIAAYEM